MTAIDIGSPLVLPCGQVLSNRLVKSAMTTGLADEHSRANYKHVNLYGAWAEGRLALQITENVPVDRRYPERPGNICIDGPQDEERMRGLRELAKAATKAGGQCWVQLTHAGRQSNFNVCPIAQAPSNISVVCPIPMPTAREMTILEIEELVERFASAAKVCQDAGFGGVQLHSAHGYLLASFLSPLSNVRTDRYGGSLENRARLLLECVDAIRARTGPSFAVSVKLNSSDFQKGGYTEDEAMRVCGWLDEAGLDLLEISGGSYESPAMFGSAQPRKASTIRREAYFQDFAERCCSTLSKTPILVTGGFRSRKGMQEALRGGEDRHDWSRQAPLRRPSLYQGAPGQHN